LAWHGVPSDNLLPRVMILMDGSGHFESETESGCLIFEITF
jgi:hypothetical protein